MVDKVCFIDELGVQRERDCTPEEQAEIDQRRAMALIPKVPEEVSIAQFQEALYDDGLLDSVDQAIAEMEGELGDKARIRWGKSPTVRRDSSWVLALSPILGLTSEKLDELFIAASKL